MSERQDWEGEDGERREESVFIDRVNTLHKHFNTVSGQVLVLQKSQERLEANDAALGDRISRLEVARVRNEGLLSTHIATTAIHLETVRDNSVALRDGLDAHMLQENKDRRAVFGLVGVTMLSSIGGLIAMLWQVLV